MTRRERPDPAALVADIPRDSGIPRYTRAEPAPVTFIEPVLNPGSVDSIETVDCSPLPEQGTHQT